MAWTKTISGNWKQVISGITVVCEKKEDGQWLAWSNLDGEYYSTLAETRKSAVRDLLEIEMEAVNLAFDK